jgi:hypothetical protein
MCAVEDVRRVLSCCACADEDPTDVSFPRRRIDGRKKPIIQISAVLPCHLI